jgi:hypothetical protein
VAGGRVGVGRGRAAERLAQAVAGGVVREALHDGRAVLERGQAVLAVVGEGARGVGRRRRALDQAGDVADHVQREVLAEAAGRGVADFVDAVVRVIGHRASSGKTYPDSGPLTPIFLLRNNFAGHNPICYLESGGLFLGARGIERNHNLVIGISGREVDDQARNLAIHRYIDVRAARGLPVKTQFVFRCIKTANSNG